MEIKRTVNGRENIEKVDEGQENMHEAKKGAVGRRWTVVP